MQRHVHSAIKELMLSSIIVDCKWFVKNTQTDTQSCGINFFKTILPHLSVQSFLDKNACIHLPMHPWCYVQLCLNQKTLEELYVVDFVKEIALDTAHQVWLGDDENKNPNLTHFHNLPQNHEFAAAEKVDEFLGKIKTCVKHDGVKKCMRSFADCFFQLEDQKFATVKWIRLRQHHVTLANKNFFTPPALEKEDLRLKRDRKGTIWMLGLPFVQSVEDNNARLQNAHTIEMKGSTDGVDSDEIENGDKDDRDKALDKVLGNLWRRCKEKDIQANEVTLRHHCS